MRALLFNEPCPVVCQAACVPLPLPKFTRQTRQPPRAKGHGRERPISPLKGPKRDLYFPFEGPFHPKAPASPQALPAPLLAPRKNQKLLLALRHCANGHPSALLPRTLARGRESEDL